MVSRVIFSVLVALFVAQVALADDESPVLCPNVEIAKTRVFNEEIHEEAPKNGRISTFLPVDAKGKKLTCILISKLEDGRDFAMANIGIPKVGDATVNLVSDVGKGIDALVEVYTD